MLAELLRGDGDTEAAGAGAVLLAEAIIELRLLRKMVQKALSRGD